MVRVKGSLVLVGLMLAACEAGPGELQVTQRVSALTASGDVMGFENASDWSSTTPGVVIGLSSTHTQGASSLAVTPSPSQTSNPINSVALSTLAASPTLAIDLMLPTKQPNPYWFGAVQLYITCPSHNVYNDYLADVELTGMAVGVWNTLTFPLPLNNPSPNGLLANLLASGYSDLTFTVVLNVPMPAGTYLFDNLRFVPVGATGCGGQPNGTSCNDSNACTSGETCQAGACVPGSTVTCAASDQCHQAGQCNPQTGACGAGQPVADWTPCNDGDLCTRGQSCQAGVCGAGQPTCEDGDPCTADNCNPSNGTCQFTPLPQAQCIALVESTPTPPTHGRIDFTNQSDNNRCVPDAAHVMNRLNAQGDLLGWQYLENGYEDLDDATWHSETLIRLPYFDPSVDSSLDGSYFVSAFSHDPTDPPAQFGVAQMGFKKGNNGRMLLTNRAYAPSDHSTSNLEADWLVTPNPADAYVAFSNRSTLFQLNVENHPGGSSALGWHVVVPFQVWIAPTVGGIQIAGGDTPPNSDSTLVMVNVHDPLSPQIESTFLSHFDTPGDSGNSAVSAAIAKLNNGHFLLALEKDTPIAKMEFYVSAGTDLDDPQLFGKDLRVPDAIIPFCNNADTNNNVTGGGECFHEPYDWQSFNFITDCNGDLYVLGMRGDVGCGFLGSGPCNDIVDEFKVELVNGNNGTATGPAYLVNMTSVDQLGAIGGVVPEASKHMYCPDNSGNDQCDFQAASGTYVDPDGQVLVYASGYDDDGGTASPTYPYVYGNGDGHVNGPWFGTNPSVSGFIRGMEFHERHGNAAVGSACPTWDNAWVEFYEQTNFNNFGDGNGQVFRVNYATRDQRPGYLGANDFNDKAHSVRWCVPPGSSIQVFEDSWEGGFTYLNGSGQVMDAADLRNFQYPYTTNGSEVGDTTTGSITTFQFVDGHTDPQNGISGSPDPGS